MSDRTVRYTYNVPLIVTVNTDTGEVEAVEINHAPSGTTMDLRRPDEVWTNTPSFTVTAEGFDIMESTVWPHPGWAGG